MSNPEPENTHENRLKLALAVEAVMSNADLVDFFLTEKLHAYEHDDGVFEDDGGNYPEAFEDKDPKEDVFQIRKNIQRRIKGATNE